MNWLQKLPNTRKSASGLEWTLWNKLPLIAVIGTLLPLAVLALVYLLMSGPSAEPDQMRWVFLLAFVVAGLVTLHWSLVLTLAIGCFIVMVMKGPGFVADGYLLPHSDQPRAMFETVKEAQANRPPDSW